MMPENEYLFPKGFLWGSAVSAFQTEGGSIDNEWNDPEYRRFVKDGRSPADSVNFLRLYGRYISLMKKMKHTAFRMSVEWARIEPSEGNYDRAALRRYREMLKALNSAKIKPFVDLHHHSNPRWFFNDGSWLNKKAISRFTRYVRMAIEALGDLTDTWLTINEPVVYAGAAYLLGEFPPRRQSPALMFRCMKSLARAHAAAYEIIHESFEKNGWGRPHVSFAKHLRRFDPCNPGNPLDVIAARLRDWVFNSLFFDMIGGNSKSMDMLCVNYYSTDIIKFPMEVLCHGDMPKSRLGWDIDPAGFYDVLVKYGGMMGLPVYVTENGVCDENDELRPKFLLDHIHQMHRALREGIDIRGYLHWSTMDNFEYTEGYTAPFGLIHVDHASGGRRIALKKSARLYGAIARANGITQEIVKKHLPEWRPL